MRNHDSSARRRFCFFGEYVDVHVHRVDYDYLEFFYGSFLSCPESGEPGLSVELHCADWPARGFFASLLAKDGLRKSIRVNSQPTGELIEEWTFTGWSTKPSPLPPFAFPPLADRLAVSPGAVVKSPGGRTVLLTGPNYVGKTATALAICERGGRLISDSAAVFDTKSGNALTYEAPLGFRKDSLARRIPVLDSSEHRLTVSPDTGLVALVSPRDVLGVENVGGSSVDAVVALRWGDAVEVATSKKRIRLPWFSQSSSFDVTKILPEMTLTVITPAGSSPADAARVVLDTVDA